MRRNHILIICLFTALRLQAQSSNGFGPLRSISERDNGGFLSVLTTDLDSDGDQDVLSASFTDDKITWYKNDGQGNFSLRLIATGGDGIRSMYVSDLDGDGDQDILAASFSFTTFSGPFDEKVVWYEHDGQGNFEEAQISTVPLKSLRSVYAADLDGDGDQDVLAAAFEKNLTVRYMNDGQGNFGEPQFITSQRFYESGVRAVATADLDGDGDQDVLSATDFGKRQEVAIRWYPNDGQGNFDELTSRTITSSASSFYTTDIDGDGDQDVLTSSKKSNEIAWYENDGQGNFGEPQAIATLANNAQSYFLSDLQSISATDLDGDGDQDVLSVSPEDNKIAWYENDGQGNFGEQQVVTLRASDVQFVLAADLDRNGDQDILGVSSSNNIIGWYASDGQGSFTEQPTIANRIVSAESVYATDLDGDGDQDVLAASSGDNKIAWYENNGQGNFAGQQLVTTQVAEAYDVFAIDLDGDGDQDVLSASSGDNKIAWYENDGQGNFGEQQVITTQATGARSVYATDCDGDGDQDVLSASFGDNKIAWYENKGQGNFGEQQVIATQAIGAQSVYATDLDGDGDQDVVSASSEDSKIAWYENNGQGDFSKQQVITTQAIEVLDVFTADLDGDGDSDILWGTDNLFEGEVAWQANDGQGSFGQPQSIAEEIGGIKSVYAADLDSDGDQDVLSSSYYFYRDLAGVDVTWYENEGTGSFEVGRPVSGEAAVSIHAVDLDGDNDLDVLSASSYKNRVGWSQNRIPQTLPLPTITTLTLLNARSDTEVRPLSDGLSLDLLSPSPDLYDYNVAAEVAAAGQTITRVTFTLEAPDAAGQDIVRTERKAPYILFGHLGKDYLPTQAYAGDYTLTATPYYQDSAGQEVAGRSKTVSFTFVTPNMDIRAPRLVDARNGEVIKHLEAGDVISLAADQLVGVQVDTRFPQYNSVEFFLDGPGIDGQAEVQALENFEPYSLFGDEGPGTFPNGRTLAPGEYELRVIAYLGKKRDGYAGPQTVIPFTVVREASESQPLAYPVPFTNELNLRTGQIDLSKAHIQVLHGYGQTYEVPPSRITLTKEGLRLNVSNLPAGPYTVYLRQTDQVSTFRAIKQ